MIKKLTRQGNSSALIIDRAVMDLLDIDNDTALRLTVEGRRLIVEPLSDAERDARFKQVMKRTATRNANLFRKLAK